ncbi:MAG: hypothetical protein JWL69_4235 [Phycisphaerales bacterium]|nr:hypothetical protein [Phycisphaerales bacterium]
MSNRRRRNDNRNVAGMSTMHRWGWAGVWCAVALCGLFSAPVRGDFVTGKTHGGVDIQIHGAVGSDVTLITTGRANSGQPPPEIRTHEQIIGQNGLKFHVPQSEADSNNVQQTVVDYKLQVIAPGAAPKLQFSLSVESFAPSGSDFSQNSVSDELFETLGDGVELRIPDFSTDGSDTLYSAVNLVNYIPGHVSFQIGDTFTITNGKSGALPGFVFGTSDILMDATSPDGFGNTSPFTGTITVAGENDPSSSIPLPPPVSAGLVLMGGLWALRWRCAHQGGRVLDRAAAEGR